MAAIEAEHSNERERLAETQTSVENAWKLTSCLFEKRSPGSCARGTFSSLMVS